MHERPANSTSLAQRQADATPLVPRFVTGQGRITSLETLAPSKPKLPFWYSMIRQDVRFPVVPSGYVFAITVSPEAAPKLTTLAQKDHVHDGPGLPELGCMQ